MVRSICLTLAAIVACIAFFIFVDIYLGREFDEFYGAVETLCDKVENTTANSADADAVRTMWSDKKSKLHMFIPHNDIAYVDYRLNEAFSYIYTDNYPLALANLEIVKRMAQTLPDNYRLKLENIL